MKEKSINLKVSNITSKQWSNLVIELNLVAQAWKPYAKLNLHASNLKKIIANGTRTHDTKED